MNASVELSEKTFFDLFLSFRWHYLAQCEKNNQSSGFNKELLGAFKFLYAISWQRLKIEYSNSELQKWKNSKIPFLVFVYGYAQLVRGIGSESPWVMGTLRRLRAPAWMGLWFQIEDAGRRRQYERQAKLIADIAAKDPTSYRWILIACMQSLDTGEFDPKPLLSHLENRKASDVYAALLRGYLLIESDRFDDARDMLLDALVCSDETAKFIAHCYLGLLEYRTLNLEACISYWASAASNGLMPRAYIDKWIALVISHPKYCRDSAKYIQAAAELVSHATLDKCAIETYGLIRKWIDGNVRGAYEFIRENKQFTYAKVANNQVVPQIFFRTIALLIRYLSENKKDYLTPEPDWERLHVIGESHCLPPCHTTFQLNGWRAYATSCFVFGIKMWHLAQPSDNIYKRLMQAWLSEIGEGANILITIGEIDCRPEKGMYSFSKTHNKPIASVIDSVVDGYLLWLDSEFQTIKPKTIIIQGIQAPGYPLEDRFENVDDSNAFIAMIRDVNNALKVRVIGRGWRFLDVYTATVGENGCSNRKWHLDANHLYPGYFSASTINTINGANHSTCPTLQGVLCTKEKSHSS